MIDKVETSLENKNAQPWPTAYQLEDELGRIKAINNAFLEALKMHLQILQSLLALEEEEKIIE